MSVVAVRCLGVEVVLFFFVVDWSSCDEEDGDGEEGEKGQR